MIRPTRLILTASLTFLVACSADHQFAQDPDISALGESKLTGKRIRLDLSGVPEVFDTSTTGHSFHVTGIRDSVRVVLTKMLGGNSIAATGAGDVTLDVDLEFSVSPHDGIGSNAQCCASCTLRAGYGKRLGAGTAESNVWGWFMSSGGGNCETAMLRALPAALEAALAEL